MTHTKKPTNVCGLLCVRNEHLTVTFMITASKRDKVKENEVLASKSKLSGMHERAQSTKTDCHEYMKGINRQKQAVMST
jgi:hypothetical protein